jgi:tyrosyl-tRNA synthetase
MIQENILHASSAIDFKSRFLRTISERGFIHQCTHFTALDALLYNAEQKGEAVSAYIGFDCTAPSLHVGSLMQIMILRLFQQCGHKPIILLGGGTTKIGDPSGKDAARQVLSDATIADNMAGIKKVFEHFVQFGDGKSDALMVNNADWLLKLNYIDFLGNVGRHFSINRMLTMESVKQRLKRDSHLSFLEFNYMVLQAYDFVELNKHYGVRLQIGGSDQWGNIVMGTELFHKLTHAQNADCYGLTTPLLTTAAGAKMGKTADGAVWLNPDMLSAYNYWQFWRNIDDADVGRFLKLFTELPMDEIATLASAEGAAINEAKKRLATHATALLHGQAAANAAAQTAKEAFELGGSSSLPSITLSTAEHGTNIPAFKLFFVSGLAESGAEARRLIKGGGAKINDEKVTDENMMIDLLAYKHTPLKLSSGKKKHFLVHIV